MNTLQTQFKSIDPDLGTFKVGESRIENPLHESQGSGAPQQGVGFLETLQKSMESVNEDQIQADSAVKDLVAGKSKNIHETMLSIQKAELSLKTMMQVRNKILEAYKEIIRMQV